MTEFVPGYRLQVGSRLERALLVKFMQRTYQELYANGNFSHLAQTVEDYFSQETPVWWVTPEGTESDADLSVSGPATQAVAQVVACLWLGNAIDQEQGDRHAHIFLLYVAPEHRHRGIGSALVQQAETWAQSRGDRQIGLQVFQKNQPALRLYQGLGYQTQSLWMVKPLT